MHLTIDTERMADFFVKHHVRGLPRAVVIHELGVDHGPAHDHPWSFISFVLHGAYTEEVFDLATGESHAVRHQEGESFPIAAGHIHRVIEVEPETVTLILPGPPERKSGFYRWEDGQAFHRHWDEQDFKPLETRQS